MRDKTKNVYRPLVSVVVGLLNWGWAVDCGFCCDNVVAAGTLNVKMLPDKALVSDNVVDEVDVAIILELPFSLYGEGGSCLMYLASMRSSCLIIICCCCCCCSSSFVLFGLIGIVLKAPPTKRVKMRKLLLS